MVGREWVRQGMWQTLAKDATTRLPTRSFIIKKAKNATNKKAKNAKKKSTQMQSAKDATRLRLMPGVYLTLVKHFDFPIVLLVTLGYMRWL